MERLTKRLSNGNITKTSDPHSFVDVLNRLAAYEDTGLTPDEVDQIRRAAQTMMFPTVADFARYAIQNFEDLQKYRKAEADGRLVMPPCKVGDTLYEIDLPEYGVIVCKVMWMILKNDVSVQVEVTDGHGLGSGYCFELSDFGRTVFHTREAAEAALKEREGK